MTETAAPVELSHREWLYTATGERLHYIATPPDENAEPGIAACGRSARWYIPGLLSRLGMPRCIPCCKRIGIAPGNGTPANERARMTRTA